MLISLLLLAPTSQAVPSGDLLIRQVHVASPGEAAAQPDRDVWIKDGVIVRIEPSGSGDEAEAAWDGAVIEGEGRFLAPGFVDAHVHLPPLGGELPPEHIEREMALHLLHGVTTLKVTRGKPEHLPLRERIDAGDVLGPRLYVSTPPLSRRAPLSPEDAPKQFAEWSDAGFDFVKYLSGASEDDYAALVEAAHGAGLAWTGHGPDGGLAAALASGQMGIEHATPFTSEARLDEEAFASVCAGLGERGVFVCPDLLFYERLSDRLNRDEVRDLEFVPAAEVASWDEECKLPDPRRPKYAEVVDSFIAELPRMHAAGIRLLVSPGSGPYIVPGAGFAEEVELLSRSGLSPEELLRAATWNAAASLGLEATSGRVAPGQRADLVLLDRDPLKDATAYLHVSGTVLAGRALDHEELRSVIDRALKKQNQ